MNAPFRQVERLGRLTTALGADVLALLRFDGTDHLNELFEYRVEALSTRDDLDFDALVGTHATVEIEAHEEMRAFDGIVTSARWAGVGENGHRYDLTLRPWFWLAARAAPGTPLTVPSSVPKYLRVRGSAPVTRV